MLDKSDKQFFDTFITLLTLINNHKESQMKKVERKMLR